MTQPTTLADVTLRLDARLDDDARAWLDQAREELRTDPTRIRMQFPSVGRKVGRGPLDAGTSTEDFFAWTVDDAARTLLLDTLGEHVHEELDGLYRHGDAAERRAVIRALPFLEIDDTVGVAFVDDALRTNDLRLIAAALGPYAVRRLDDHALAHAALKCVFVDLPLGRVEGLLERTTPELSRMLGAYVHERVAAGRSVPDDVWPVIDRFPPEAELAAIEAETQHEVEDRRRAAKAALAGRARAADS